MDATTLALLVVLGVVLLLGGLALVVAVAGVVIAALQPPRWTWLDAAEALGLAVERSQRPLDELGPGVAALMARARKLAGFARLQGTRAGFEFELVQRSDDSARGRFTQVRVRRKGGLAGAVWCSPRLGLDAVSRELGEPVWTFALPPLGELAVWTQSESRPDPSVLLDLQEGDLLCFNDDWVCLEVEGAHADPVVLDAMIDRAVATAQNLAAC